MLVFIVSMLNENNFFSVIVRLNPQSQLCKEAAGLLDPNIHAKTVGSHSIWQLIIDNA
jgi:hypothetical protein